MHSFSLICGVLALLVLLFSPSAVRAATWDGGKPSADAACKDRVNEEGAYKYVRAQPTDGGKAAECMMKIKEGEGEEIVDARVAKDDPPPEEQKADSSKDSAAAASKPKVDDKFIMNCIAFESADWMPELDAAYKAPITGGGAGSGLKENQNIAVLEWKEGGATKRQWFASTVKKEHSEQHILAFLKSKGIKREDVTRIYTELSPCVKKCFPALSEHFKGIRKNITIDYTWNHSDYKEYTNCGKQEAYQERLQKKRDRREKVAAK